VNGAYALDQTTRLGRIRPGFQADLIAVPMDEKSDDIFETIISWDRAVPWSMIGGVVTRSDS
jgi:imidazolonepropionase-like amidohydrolase